MIIQYEITSFWNVWLVFDMLGGRDALVNLHDGP